MTLEYLVLFDIDGTLLWPDGAGRAAMQAALEQVYGTAGPIDAYRFGGRTDRQIVRDLMLEAGLAPEIIWARFDAFAQALADETRARLSNGRHHVRACTGGPELVAALDARHDVLPGLLTGNLETTARLKLAAAGYDPTLFRVGAFGGESTERSELAALAVHRAREQWAPFEGPRIVVVGDTPADIRCGEALGVRTIGVLTGWNSRAELEDAGADVIFDDLSDTAAVLTAMLVP